MSTNFRNKKTSVNPINGKNYQTTLSKSKINLNSEYSANNKINSVHRNTSSLGNISLSNGKISTIISPFMALQGSIGEVITDQQDSPLSHNNKNDKVVMKIPKKNKNKNEEQDLFNKDEFNDKIVEFMSKKLDSLSSIIKNSEANYQEVITNQHTLIRFDENIPNSYFDKTYENDDTEYVEDGDNESKYLPYSNEEKEKILQELEYDAINRQTKYFDLFRNLKFEVKETLHFAYAFNESNVNLGIIDPAEFIKKNGDAKQPESLNVEQLETEMYPTNYTKETSVIVNEKFELNRKSRLNTVVKPILTPKKNTHTIDLKKRLNNLKSDGKPTLQIRSMNKQKTTAEKLYVVKKMGRTNQQRTMTISKGSKKIQETDSSFINNEATNNNQVPITKFYNPMNENLRRKISNGASIVTSSKDLVEQEYPRKRFNTQTKPRRTKTQEIKKDVMILEKINSNSENKESVLLTLKNADITASMKKSITTLIVPNSRVDHDKLDIGKKKIRSNTVRFNLQNNNQNTGEPIFNQNTSSPIMSEFKSEEDVHEFKIELKEAGEARPQIESEIKYIFKSIILKDNTEKDTSNASFNINLPQKSSNKKSLVINTIDSVPCQDNSDSETPDPLNYYTLHEESVIHKFPVLCFNTNNLSNESSMSMGRNKKNKTEKILIHAGSGKRIKPEVALESFDNQENSNEVVILYIYLINTFRVHFLSVNQNALFYKFLLRIK